MRGSPKSIALEMRDSYLLTGEQLLTGVSNE